MDGCAEVVCPEGEIHARCNNGGAVILTQVCCSRQGVTTPSIHTFILNEEYAILTLTRIQLTVN